MSAQSLSVVQGVRGGREMIIHHLDTPEYRLSDSLCVFANEIRSARASSYLSPCLFCLDSQNSTMTSLSIWLQAFSGKTNGFQVKRVKSHLFLRRVLPFCSRIGTRVWNQRKYHLKCKGYSFPKDLPHPIPLYSSVCCEHIIFFCSSVIRFSVSGKKRGKIVMPKSPVRNLWLWDEVKTTLASR